MEFDHFYEKYKPIRNTFDLSSPIFNLMFEKQEEEQLEFIESKSPSRVWTYRVTEEKEELVNGIGYGEECLGYIVCNVPCAFESGSLTVKI